MREDKARILNASRWHSSQKWGLTILVEIIGRICDWWGRSCIRINDLRLSLRRGDGRCISDGGECYAVQNSGLTSDGFVVVRNNGFGYEKPLS